MNTLTQNCQGRFLLAPRLAVVVLSLPVIRGFLSDSYPVSADGVLHLMRAIAFDQAARTGDLWPRFLTPLHYGYGSPIYNYMGPLSLYPVELLHLVGMGFIRAVLGATILYILVGGLGAYQLGEALDSPAAGIVAAVGFVYSASFAYFGNLAQYAALSFLPWALWALWALSTHQKSRYLLLTVLFMSLPVMMHNISALIIAGLAVLVGAVLVILSRQRIKTLALLALAGVLVVGVTVFTWLPALAEQEYIRLDLLENFDFHTYFVPLAETMAFTPHPGAERILLSADYTVHWPQLLLALTALAVLFIPRRNEDAKVQSATRAWTGVCIGLFVLLLFLTTRVSTAVWDAVPMMDLILFPSRLLSPASLFLAVAAGLGVSEVMHRVQVQPLRIALLLVVLAAVIVYALPVIHVDYMNPNPPSETVLDVHQIERDTGWLGATSAGEYRPRWAKDIYAWGLTDRYSQNSVIARLRTNEVIEVIHENWGQKSVVLELAASEETTLIFEWLYFPGWYAWVDGEPVELRPTTPKGLVALELPQGRHTVELRFGLTPLRRAATWISLASLTGLVMAAVLLPRYLPPEPQPVHNDGAA